MEQTKKKKKKKKKKIIKINVHEIVKYLRSMNIV